MKTHEQRYDTVDDAAAMLTNGYFDFPLLRYEYDRARAAFVLITEWPATAAGSNRAFARFTFAGVSRFERVAGDRCEYQIYREAYRYAGREAGARLFFVQCVQAVSGTCDLDVGYEFGAVLLEFENVSAWIVHTAGTKVGPEEWAYRNARTGEPLDWKNPFGDAASLSA